MAGSFPSLAGCGGRGLLRSWRQRLSSVPRGRRRRCGSGEISELASASDLAVENVYGSFRSRLCRYANVPSDTPTNRLAEAAAARGQVDARRLRTVMRRCEEAMKGAPPSPQDLLRLVAQVREVERELKL